MQKDDLIRLYHMLDAASECIHFSRNKTRRSLDTDRKLVLALVKSIAIRTPGCRGHFPDNQVLGSFTYYIF